MAIAMSQKNSPLLKALFDCLTQCIQCERVVVAYSGGVDSHSLLHVAKCLSDRHEYGIDLLALHINHQLQVGSDTWVTHCRSICTRLGVEFKAINVDARPSRGQSPEEAARNARYHAIEQQLQRGDLLLTAHHQDDQAETVLLQLLRGSGVAGLAAMLPSRPLGKAIHARPFLSVAREAIADYADHHKLDFIEDPSNQNDQFHRNYLRRTVMPLILARWPSAAAVIARAAHNSAKAQHLNQQLASMDRQTVEYEGNIRIAALRALAYSRQQNVLRHWIRNKTGRFPSSKKLQAINTTVLAARQDANPLVELGRYQLRRYRDTLYLVPQVHETLPKDWLVKWSNPGQPLSIDELGTRLVPDILPQPLPQGVCITVRLRQGGEVLSRKGRPKKALKDVFQEAAVPPWQRHRIPLIYYNDDLVGLDLSCG